MEKLALLARVQAKPGQEDTVENFLKQALALAQQEEGTLRWYAFKMNENTFGIFDTFESEWTCNTILDKFLSNTLKLPIIIVERGKIA